MAAAAAAATTTTTATATTTTTTTATAASPSPSPSPLVALITGASRGIGLGLVEVFASKGYRVVAAVRDPTNASQLQALIKANPLVSAVALDVSDSKSIAALPGALTAANVARVDVLINNAGIKSPSETASGGVPRSLATETAADFTAVLQTNVLGPWAVTQAVLPHLRAATRPGGAVVVNVSSVMGSIASLIASDPASATAHNPVYRISKAAVNSLSACQAREFNADAVAAAAAAAAAAVASGSAAATTAAVPAPRQLVTVLAVHPGWVQTDMGKSGGRQPPVTVAQSSGGIASLAVNAAPNANAVFLNFDGTPLPW